MPARASIEHGVTSQSAAGIAHAVSVHVASNGRVEGEWTASMKCGKQTLMRTNHTPTTTVKADGTFSRVEHFNVPYVHGVDGALHGDVQGPLPGRRRHRHAAAADDHAQEGTPLPAVRQRRADVVHALIGGARR